VALLPRVQRPRLPWLVAPAALGGLALLGVSWHLFGGVPAVDEYGTLAPSQILNGLAGLFFDRQFGLLVYAPIYLLAVFGLPLLPRRLPSLAAWSILVLLGAYTVFIAGFSYWYGAFSPPSRMLVPVVPVLAVPLALALAHLPPWRCRSLAGVLSLLSLAVVVLLVRVPRLRYNQSDGHSEVLHYLSETWGRDLTAVVPSFLVPSADAYAWAMGATVAIGVLYFLLTVSPTRSVR
jgi:hypothetical protein